MTSVYQDLPPELHEQLTGLILSSHEIDSLDIKNFAAKHQRKYLNAIVFTAATHGVILKVDGLVHETIEGFSILCCIGEGHSGKVYLAMDTNTGEKVALKVLKQGTVGADFLRRFRQEGKILNSLSHSGIVRGRSARSTQDGRLFIAMDFVDGIPITEFCRKYTNSLNERLELFLSVCNSVKAAHMKGIIHRDLSPNNILVEHETHSTKIIDFGQAKTTEEIAGQTNPMSEYGMSMGTVPYMTPEQANGLSAEPDTRMDVYSLGAILYEMLTDEPLFKIDGRIRDKIINETPLTMSRRIEMERSEAPIPWHDLRTDLDVIVARAVEKDPDHRFPNVDSFAEDISRFLKNEPIESRAPSKVYFLKMFVRRNRAASLAIVASILFLIIGVIATSVFYYKASNNAEIASIEARKNKEEAQKFEQVVLFYEDLLSESKPNKLGHRLKKNFVDAIFTPLDEKKKAIVEDWISSLQFTDLAAGVIDEYLLSPTTEKLKLAPVNALFRARILRAVSAASFGLGLYTKAAKTAEHSFKIRSRILGVEHADTLESLVSFHSAVLSSKETKPIASTIKLCVDRCKKNLGLQHPTTLYSIGNLADFYTLNGDPEAAKPFHSLAFEGMKSNFGLNHRATLASYSSLAGSMHLSGSYSDALVVYDELVPLSSRVLGEHDQTTLRANSNRALCLFELGRRSEGLKLCKDTLEATREELGSHHVSTIELMGDFGDLLRRSGRLTQSESIIRHAAEIGISTLGERHRTALHLRRTRMRLRVHLGEYETALGLVDHLVSDCVDVLGPEHPWTLSTQEDRGVCLLHLGRQSEASAILQDLLGDRVKASGWDNRATIKTASLALAALLESGKTKKAWELGNRIAPIAEKIFGDRHQVSLTIMANRANSFIRMGQTKLASTLLSNVYEKRLEAFGWAHQDTRSAAKNLGIFLSNIGKVDEAKRMLEVVYQKCVKFQGPDDPTGLTALAHLGRILSMQGRLKEGEEKVKAVLTRQIQLNGSDSAETIRTNSMLAMIYWRQGNLGKAEATFKETIAGLLKNMEASHPEAIKARSNLCVVIANRGRYRESLEIYHQLLNTCAQDWGPSHTHTRAVKNSLLQLVVACAAVKIEMTELKKIVNIAGRALGTDHPAVLKLKKKLDE